MPLAAIAPALLAVALLLALGFRRNRAVQALAVLTAMATAILDGDPRLAIGALRFGPPLLIVALALPEPGLMSRRNGWYVLAALLLALFVASAPVHVFERGIALMRWLAFGHEAAPAAATLTALAALLGLLRWTLTARPMEFGLALTLALAAIAVVQPAESAAAWFAAAGACAILAVLYASYRYAFVDGLTGLPNRRALDETLQRLSGPFALAMVDVDHFKQFNDTYGHDAGDVVLREVAKSLRRHAGGQAFRYGGEEFCVVFDGRKADDAPAHCENARAQIQARKIAVPASPKRRRNTDDAKTKKLEHVSVTISAGCAARGPQRRPAHEVLKIADQALYKAKQKGRNRVVGA